MKRIIKLSQIKQSEYFKEFNWDSLLSFNLEPSYIIQMQQEKLNDPIPYETYVKEKLADFKPPKDSKPDVNYRQQVDDWFKKF